VSKFEEHFEAGETVVLYGRHAKGYEGAVGTTEGHDVGNGADGDEGKQIEVAQGGGLAEFLDEGTHQLVSDAHAGEVVVTLAAWDGLFGVYAGGGFGEIGGQVVVIGDDDVEAGTAGLCYFASAGDAAIYGDEELSAAASDFLDGGGVETVALKDAIGDIRLDEGTEVAQGDGEEGGGGYAVGIEVAVDDDLFAGAYGFCYTVDGLGHAGELERIGVGGEVGGIEESLYVVRSGDATIGEQPYH
jgi:hypothetical protein